MYSFLIGVKGPVVFQKVFQFLNINAGKQTQAVLVMVHPCNVCTSDLSRAPVSEMKCV